MHKGGGLGRLWTTRTGNRLLGLGLPAAGLILLGGMAVIGFNPVGILPPCLFLRLTGLRCPGCGTTRMAAALLRGDVGGAWYYNPFTLLLGTGFVLWLLWIGIRSFRKNWSPPRSPMKYRWWWWLLPLSVLVFWLVRNLPLYQSFFF